MSTRWLSEGGWHSSVWLVGASPKVRETRPAGWISGGSFLEYQSHHEEEVAGKMYEVRGPTRTRGEYYRNFQMEWMSRLKDK